MNFRPLFKDLRKEFGRGTALCESPAEGAQQDTVVHHSKTEQMLLVDAKKLKAVCSYLRAYADISFDYLIGMTAVDFPERNEFELLYFLYSMEKNVRLTLKCILPRKKPSIDSVIAVWKAAEYPEREVYDLYGVKFTRHPDLRRIFLDDDFNGHPMRRDWKGKELIRLPEVGPR